jgi:hypothetical protein
MVTRNQANPEVELSIIEEQGFTFQSGLKAVDNLYIGLQARLFERKFIRKRFKLLELATPESQDLLIPKKQTATYLEPGMSYFFKHKWKPRISLFVANLGSVSKTYEDLPAPMEAQFGFGITPPLYWGTLDLSLDYRSMSYDEDNFEKLRLSSLYHFGSMYLSGGIDSNGASGGIFYGLANFNSGITFSTTRFTSNDEFFTQAVYVQLGWQI